MRRSLFAILVRDRIQEAESPPSRERHYHVPNPFTCIKLLCNKANFAVICIGSITYTVKMALQTSLAAQCVDIYQLDYLQAGLVYIPSGVGGAIGSFVTGEPRVWYSYMAVFAESAHTNKEKGNF